MYVYIYIYIYTYIHIYNCMCVYMFHTHTPAKNTSTNFRLYPCLEGVLQTEVFYKLSQTSKILYGGVLQTVLGMGMGMNVTAHRLRECAVHGIALQGSAS